MYYEKLDNGLEAVFEESRFSEVVALHVMVKIGSAHESKSERGLSHFIEHMLFKGTAERGVGDISQEVEALGGEINAYTTFDRTVYYMTLPAKHINAGLEILSDAIWNSTFDDDALCKEKEVIIEEIRRGLDSPSAQLGRPVFEHFFAGNEAARPIIGDEASVSQYNRQNLVDFYRKYYRPQNMSVIVTGHFDLDPAREMVGKLFGSHDANEAGGSEPKMDRIKILKGNKVFLQKGKYKQPRLEIAFRAPHQDDPDSVLLDLAAFALGSGDASRLTSRLCHQSDAVSSVGASIYSSSFGGVFFVSALTEEASYLEAIRMIAVELRRLKHSEPISSDELLRARNDLKVGKLYREETVSGRARALETSLGSATKLFYHEIYEKVIEAATSRRVSEALDRWLEIDEPVISCLLPEDSSISETDVLAAYRKGMEEKPDPKEALPVHRADPDASHNAPIKVAEIFPGLRLVHRHHPQEGMFTVACVTEGGQRADGMTKPGLQNALASQISYGPSDMAYQDFLSAVEGSGSYIEGFSGKDSFGLRMSCLQDVAPEILSILCATLKSPAFREEQWAAEKREIDEVFRSQKDSPATVAMRAFQKLIYPDHPYRLPLAGEASYINSLCTTSLRCEYESFRSSGPWVLSVVSHLPFNRVEELVRTAFVGFASSIKPRDFAKSPLKFQQAHSVSIDMPREQSHIVLGVPGICWEDEDRAALDVLATILGGSGGRFFRRLRDELSLAYTVSPILSYGRDYGAFGAYIACAPSKVAVAQRELEAQMLQSKEGRISEKEISRAVEYIVGNHVTDLQRADAQAMTMALMEAYGFGFDDFLTYPEKIRQVTREDIQRVANRVLAPSSFSVVVGPH